jgi:hypothetical protein
MCSVPPLPVFSCECATNQKPHTNSLCTVVVAPINTALTLHLLRVPPSHPTCTDQYRRKTAAAAAAGNGRQRGSYLAGQPPLMQGRGTGNSFQMGAAGGFMMPPLMRRPPDQPSCAEVSATCPNWSCSGLRCGKVLFVCTCVSLQHPWFCVTT